MIEFIEYQSNKSFFAAILFVLMISGCNFSDKADRVFEKDELWSVRMANTVMLKTENLVSYNNNNDKIWQYDVALLGQAIDKLGYIDEKYSKYLQDFIDFYIEEDGAIRYFPEDKYTLDYINPAKSLITLYKRTGDDKYFHAIESIIDHIKNLPTTNSGVYWYEQINPGLIYIDGIYMFSPFLAQYAKEFNAPTWFSTVISQIENIYSKTFDSSTGLLYNAWDEYRGQPWCNPETGQSQFLISRSLGLYMMAIVDVLDHLPESIEGRDRLIEIIGQLSSAVLVHRDNETGLWYQVPHNKKIDGNFPETSASAMFTYVFAKASKKGYIEKKYYRIAQNSFDAMVKEFILIDDDGLVTLTNICNGQNLDSSVVNLDGTSHYNEGVENDPKGFGPFILAAIELNN